VLPCGGGGLISGAALALSNLCPDVPIYSAEPADFNDTARSLTSGERERVSPDARSICDALLTPTPGVITFALNQALLSGGLSVTDAEALAAMRTAFLDLKLVVEPGGAVALASILSGKLPPGDDPVVAVLSGGNVDPETFQTALES
jgi:threonine dehydratase